MHISHFPEHVTLMARFSSYPPMGWVRRPRAVAGRGRSLGPGLPPALCPQATHVTSLTSFPLLVTGHRVPVLSILQVLLGSGEITATQALPKGLWI